jgi:sugar (pentulose or hexulose) kinase
MTTKGDIVAVIDIGKTNVKLALVDMDRLCEIAVVTQPNTVLPGPPYPHFDVANIWDFIVKSMFEFSKIYEISSITTTTHGACCTLLDGHGDLVTPIMDYEFDGPDELASDYDKIRPDFSETGSPRLPGGLNIGAQLFWLFETFPELKTHTKNVVTYPQYWAARLTDTIVNEYTSLGCHTDVWNPVAATDSSLVDKAGWAGLLAPVVQANSQVGTVTDKIAADMGLGSQTPVYCGIHDSNASLFPHLLKRDTPFSVISTGTWVISMAVGSNSVSLDPARDTLMNVSGLCQPVPSARFMGGREFEILMDGRPQNYSADAVASVLKAKSMLLPSVVTTSGPYQNLSGHWVNVKETMGAGEYYAAVSFYLALMTSTCLDLVKADGIIVVEGPFAKNELYCLMLEAVTSRQVLPSIGTGTSIGAALLTIENQFHEKHVDGGLLGPSDGFDDYAEYWQSLLNKDE